MSKPNLLPYYQVKLTLLKCKLSFLENPPQTEDEQYAYDIIQKGYDINEKKIEMIYETVLFVLVACVAVFSLVFCVIPGTMDYACKDYVVYTGSFEVYGSMRRTRIKLEDGTVLYGSAGFDNGETYGTVVYAKRTKLVLGGE